MSGKAITANDRSEENFSLIKYIRGNERIGEWYCMKKYLGVGLSIGIL